MSDIVERLQSYVASGSDLLIEEIRLYREAADEIERLRRREALWQELWAASSCDHEMDRYDELLRLLGLSSGPA